MTKEPFEERRHSIVLVILQEASRVLKAGVGGRDYYNHNTTSNGKLRRITF